MQSDNLHAQIALEIGAPAWMRVDDVEQPFDAPHLPTPHGAVSLPCPCPLASRPPSQSPGASQLQALNATIAADPWRRGPMRMGFLLRLSGSTGFPRMARKLSAVPQVVGVKMYPACENPFLCKEEC